MGNKTCARLTVDVNFQEKVWVKLTNVAVRALCLYYGRAQKTPPTFEKDAAGFYEIPLDELMDFLKNHNETKAETLICGGYFRLKIVGG